VIKRNLLNCQKLAINKDAGVVSFGNFEKLEERLRCSKKT